MIVDDLVVTQVRKDGRSPVFLQIVGTRTRDSFVLAELALHQSGVPQIPDADANIEAITQQIVRAVIIIDTQFQLGVPRCKPGDDR